MPRPKGIICNLCNGEFFKSSYPIHRKKCEKKYVQCNTSCEYCGRMVPNADMNTHVGQCKKRNKGKTLKQKQAMLQRKQAKLLARAAEDAGVDPNGDVDEQVRAMERKLAALKAAQQSAKSVIENDQNGPGGGRTGKKIDLMAEIEKAANTIVNPDAEADGRIPCSCCGRKFAAARICLHEDICLRSHERAAKNKKKHKAKTGEELRLKGTEFEKYKDKRSDPIITNKKDWREEASKLHQVVKEGRNVVRFQRAGVPLSELPAAGQDMELHVGNAVMTNDGRRGVVKFVGDVLELPGDDMGAVRTFIGVEFNRPTGQGDGSVEGVRYFDGRPGHCSFMRPAKLLRVHSEHGEDIKTNVRRKRNGFQKKRPPAKETMTAVQRKNRDKQSEQKRKDTVARRAAALAAERAKRGEKIGARLRAQREAAGKERAHQLKLEHAAEDGDEDAIEALKKLKEEGKYMKIAGQFQSKELSQVKMGKRIPPSESKRGTEKQASQAKRSTRQQEAINKPQKPPSPPVPQASHEAHSPAPAPARPNPKKQEQETFNRQRQPQRPSVPSRASAAAEAASRRAQANMSTAHPASTKPDKLRQEVRASREKQERRPSSREMGDKRATNAKPPVSREERARVAAARRQALERVKTRKSSSNSKENSAPLSRGQVTWSKPKGQGTKRGDPYNGSGLSDASRKYRAKKANGNGGVGNDMVAASAVYKARMRAKERKTKKKTKPLGTSYATPGSMAWNAQKAKEKAKGKAAFGSGAGSVADDLNEHVFGKNKVQRKIYTSDGKTKDLAKNRLKAGGAKKQIGAPASGAGRTTRTSPTSNAHVDMGRGGKKLGGSKVKQAAMDPREARLRALAARGLM